MRLRSLLLLAVIPCSAFAQDAAPAKPAAQPKTELAFNAGYALDNAYMSFERGGFLRGSLSLLKNKGHFQYGTTLEGGTNSNDYWYLAPGVVANYRGLGRSYWYAGSMAGYNVTGNMLALRHTGERDLNHGYVFGLQAGRVQQISKRFSLSAEAGVRSSQNWIRYDEPGFGWGASSYDHAAVVVSFPVTIGVRYAL